MKLSIAAVALLLPLMASPIIAHEFAAGSLEIVHPYLRATPPMAQTGAGYVILRNSGVEADRLLAIETPAADRVEFHQSVVENSIATMVPIQGGLEIPAGGEYRLGMDGTHAMLVGLKAPIRLGEVIEGTLVFEKAGRVDITFEVERAGTTLDQAEKDHGNGH